MFNGLEGSRGVDKFKVWNGIRGSTTPGSLTQLTVPKTSNGGGLGFVACMCNRHLNLID